MFGTNIRVVYDKIYRPRNLAKFYTLFWKFVVNLEGNLGSILMLNTIQIVPNILFKKATILDELAYIIFVYYS